MYTKYILYTKALILINDLIYLILRKKIIIKDYFDFDLSKFINVFNKI